jgi:hypothetical protein
MLYHTMLHSSTLCVHTLSANNTENNYNSTWKSAQCENTKTRDELYLIKLCAIDVLFEDIIISRTANDQ